MRAATVEGLTPDGRTLLVRVGGPDGEVVEVPLAEVRAAQRSVPSLPLEGGPSPREIQHRIRHGETAEAIAEAFGLPVEHVARYEGPVLGERAHHAQAARRAEVDGRTVEDLVVDHLGEAVVWDCWQTDPHRWELTAAADGVVLRMAWDPRAQRVDALDDAARAALHPELPPPDALDAVLRPRADRSPDAPPVASPPAAAPAKRPRVQVPLWDDINTEVRGRPRPAGG